jgi:ABC-2 type transport system permease protein
MTILLAFAYLPYALARERPVVDRLRVTASLDAAIGTKLGHFTLLSLVPVLATAVAADALGYDIAPLSPLALVGLVLTFGYLGALSTAVMVALDFSWTGRVINLLLVVVGVLLSNLVYPAGYFSPIRRSVARLSPLHHSAIVVRSGVLKGSELGLFADRLAGLALTTAVALFVLKLAIMRYERRA